MVQSAVIDDKTHAVFEFSYDAAAAAEPEKKPAADQTPAAAPAAAGAEKPAGAPEATPAVAAAEKPAGERRRHRMPPQTGQSEAPAPSPPSPR
jgi:hypothetical protein